MTVFFQIVLINLAVSCDNVGVIAMATRGLPPRRAAALRRLGIGFAPVLTLAFLWAAGRLLDISWLHMRILGGAAMLYVTWQMVREGAKCRPPEQSSPSRGCCCTGDTRLAAVSIAASDLTMAMENAMAVLSVLSEDGRVPDVQEFMLAAASLLICLPVLFWGSSLVARALEEVPAVSALFAGYMAYTAVNMTLADESMALLLAAAHIRRPVLAAVACGALTALAAYGMRRANEGQPDIRPGKPGPRSAAKAHPTGGPLSSSTAASLLLAAAVLAYALATVHVFAHLARGPMIGEIGVSPELLFGFSPSAAAASRAVGAPPHLLSLFTCILAVRKATHAAGSADLFAAFRAVCARVAGMILLYTLLCSVGFGLVFGMGRPAPLDALCRLGLQILLHFAYAALFFSLSMLVKNRAAAMLLGIFWLMAEDILVDVFCYSGHLWILAGFLPEYYIHALSFMPLSALLAARAVLAAVIFILPFFAAASRRQERRGPGSAQ